jgi:twitching motility protein PilT
MIVNPAIRALIRDNKAHQIMSIIQTGGQLGMKTMNQSIYELYRSGAVSYEDALERSPDQTDFQRLMQRSVSGPTRTGSSRRSR